jgi:hypothetical protein
MNKAYTVKLADWHGELCVLFPLPSREREAVKK